MLRNLHRILFPPVLLRMVLGDTTSQGEKKVALSFSLSFRIHVVILHAYPRAHRSCLHVSFWGRSSNFGAYGLPWWGFLIWITPSDGPLLSRMFAWRTRRVGAKTLALFRKIDEDSGGSTSCDTQPNCSASFKKATALLSPFFRVFAGLIFVLLVHKRAFIIEFAFRFSLVELTFGGCQKSRDGLVHLPFVMWSLHGCPANFPDGLRALRLFLLEVFLLSFSVGGREGGTDFGVVFARLFSSCWKLQLSPLEHCPFVSVGNILAVLFQYHDHSCDSEPLLLCFSSPSFPIISDNLVSIHFHRKKKAVVFFFWRGLISVCSYSFWRRSNNF